MKKKKPTKITKAELEEIQKYVKAINEATVQVGGLELQKQEVVKNIDTLRAGLKDVQDALEKIYGNVSISLVDGTIQDNASNS